MNIRRPNRPYTPERWSRTRPVFVGGTGRCGTHVVAALAGRSGRLRRGPRGAPPARRARAPSRPSPSAEQPARAWSERLRTHWWRHRPPWDPTADARRPPDRPAPPLRCRGRPARDEPSRRRPRLALAAPRRPPARPAGAQPRRLGREVARTTAPPPASCIGCSRSMRLVHVDPRRPRRRLLVHAGALGARRLRRRPRALGARACSTPTGARSQVPVRAGPPRRCSRTSSPSTATPPTGRSSDFLEVPDDPELRVLLRPRADAGRAPASAAGAADLPPRGARAARTPSTGDAPWTRLAGVPAGCRAAARAPRFTGADRGARPLAARPLGRCHGDPPRPLTALSRLTLDDDATTRTRSSAAGSRSGRTRAPGWSPTPASPGSTSRQPEELRAGDAALPLRRAPRRPPQVLLGRRRDRPLPPPPRLQRRSTRWATTPSASPPRTTRSRPASTRARRPRSPSRPSASSSSGGGSRSTGPASWAPTSPPTTAGPSGSS